MTSSAKVYWPESDSRSAGLRAPDAVAHRGDRKSAQGQLARQRFADLAQGPVDPLRRDFRGAERSGGAQDDQVLERVAEPSGLLQGMDVARADERRTWEAGIPNKRLRSFESNSCISSASGLSCGRLGDGALGLLALLEARGLRSARVDARAQRLHQIDHLAARGRNRASVTEISLPWTFFWIGASTRP